MSQKILVLGASGYVGSRLVVALINKGFMVRAAGRSIDSLQSRPWAGHPAVEFFPVDVLDVASLEKACAGCECAYYLVHSMNPREKNFEVADRLAARNMTLAAARQGVKRIIYLGGLGDSHSDLSRHLRSRAEVSGILHGGRVPVTTLRAAMIIGTGSISFEILCYLVKRLPVMVTPRWVDTESQPIAIRNVIGYLVGCLDYKYTAGRIYDIGGPDIVTYAQLMTMYAQEAGLRKRLVIPVPILTPRLSSYWIHLVTPVPASLARPLAEGLKNRVVCQDSRIRQIISQKLIGCRQAIRLAINLEQRGSDNLFYNEEFPPPEQKYPGDPVWAGGAQ